MSPSQEIGATIPNDTAHAVSVTLPTWEATVGYEEGEEWVVSKMKSGYPRFFIHGIIQELSKNIETKYGREGEKAMIFPSYKVAKRCRDFIKRYSQSGNNVRILQLSTPPPMNEDERSFIIESNIGVCFFHEEEWPIAKQYWQHSGEGISSRMGEYLLRELFQKEKTTRKLATLKQELQVQRIQRKSPSLSKSFSSTQEEVDNEYFAFIEQKFGRVLDLKFALEAKRALRRRICGKADKSRNQIEELEKSKRGKSLSETDVYLLPSGMNAIFTAHQALLQLFPNRESVCFGFPYVDTLNILKKWGPGVLFLGFGDDKSLDELEEKLQSNSISIAGLFCECPSNPLLKTPNLKRIRSLADKYDFVVVVDETVGNFLNIHVLPYADMVVSSLTKVFSGDSNVMAGSLILNPKSSKYTQLKHYFTTEFEDIFWAEDALYLERNSRDFTERSIKIDQTTLETVELFTKSPLISKVYYPTLSASKSYYDNIKTANGGYGGLFSILFHDPNDAICFFNTIQLHKGPSLGTNFTLACPYAILAHYQELDEIAQWGVDRNLIRISVGLEDKDVLLETLQLGLDKAAAQHT
ncbi:uncharacterized protein KQ657_002122 [Scheffersomyces spartinae]|uniref:cystathionine gamma-synthase n=1 Tax=Scheffersomyces spartinae TaxID=45513 RepID=A0A9P8AL52_9ASCO|nr:uncharacterized protein KQ657_002122 [Scheffersomyces spartinae]KAG7195739.1 hypothetical protein KQ657_002122 [Scheffersomyces spartinae]